MTITPYTASFTPKCSGVNVATAGVTTAATAYEWFAVTGTGALANKIASMPTSTIDQRINKAFMQSIAFDARTALMPLIKEEFFNNKFAVTKILVTNSINSMLNTLTNIQDPTKLSIINTLTPSYKTNLDIISLSVNSLKSFEAAIWQRGTSLDLTSSIIGTTYSATKTLSSFSGVKVYLSFMLDPQTLSGGLAIPVITSGKNNVGNALLLSTRYTDALDNINEMSTLSNMQARVSMSAQNIFDLYCMEIQGYSSSSTTGKWASGSAPVGLKPGIDYEVHLTGAYQTGAASAGVAGAPSSTIDFW